MRRSDLLKIHAGELAVAAGLDPESRISNPDKPGKTMPAGLASAARQRLNRRGRN